MTTNTGALAVRRNEERALLEKNLVGSLIYFGVGRRPYLASDALGICPPGCFISPAKAAMQAIAEIVRQGLPVDLVTVADALKRQSDGRDLPVHPAEFSTWATASDLITESSVLRAAAMIAAEWRKDEALVELENGMEAMRSFGGQVDSVVESLRRAQGILDQDGLDGRDDLDACLDSYAAQIEQKGVCRPVKSPWESINRILRGGVLPGELLILAARPSVGKSALALNWGWSVACSGKAVPFFSLEMGKEQLVERLIANAGNIDLGAFRQGLNAWQKAEAGKTMLTMRGRPLEVIEQARMTVGEVRRRVRNMQRRREIGLVVVDYLQLVTPDDGRVPREQQVAAMSRGFKQLAKELGVPVLLLAQLSRKGEDANREPILSDLRESGAIEQDADIVIFLHQARRRTWHADEPVKFIIAKGRSSGVGRDSLIFRRRVQRFEASDDAAFETARREEEREMFPHYSETEQRELA